MNHLPNLADLAESYPTSIPRFQYVKFPLRKSSVLLMQPLKALFHYWIHYPKFLSALGAFGIFSLIHHACISWSGRCKFSDMQITCANFISTTQ